MPIAQVHNEASFSKKKLQKLITFDPVHIFLAYNSG
jgi:hypothetical protein